MTGLGRPVRQNDGDVGQEATDRERKKPRKTMAMGPSTSLNFESAAGGDQSGGRHQDPHFVGVKQLVQRLEKAGH